MALPHSRYETFVTDDVVGGSILMALQLWLVRFMRKFTRKPNTLVLSPFGMPEGWTGFAAGASTMYVTSTAGAVAHRIPLLMRHGDVISSISIRYWRNGATNLTFALKRYSLTAASGPTTVSSATLSAGPGSWQTGTGGSMPHTIDGAYAYFLEVTSGQASDRLGQIRVGFHHP